VSGLSGNERTVEVAAITPEGKYLATGHTDGTARVWQIETREQVLALNADASAISAIAFSSDGSQLVTSSRSGTTYVWRVSQSELRTALWDATSFCPNASQRAELFGSATDAANESCLLGVRR
jgi:WD40 repeat protein